MRCLVALQVAVMITAFDVPAFGCEFSFSTRSEIFVDDPEIARLDSGLAWWMQLLDRDVIVGNARARHAIGTDLVARNTLVRAQSPDADVTRPEFLQLREENGGLATPTDEAGIGPVSGALLNDASELHVGDAECAPAEGCSGFGGAGFNSKGGGFCEWLGKLEAEAEEHNTTGFFDINYYWDETELA